MHIKDHSAAMKFFRTYDNVASKGKWKEFVDEMEFDSMVQEPRTTAHEPRNMAHGGMIGKPGGLVEEGVEYYSQKIYKVTVGSHKGDWALAEPTWHPATKTKSTKNRYFKSKTDLNNYLKETKTPPKYSKTELNKAAQHFFNKNYNEIDSKQQAKAYQRIRSGEGKFSKVTQADPLKPAQQAKILKEYPDAKFTPTNRYGFKPDHPLYQTVQRFVDNDFKLPYEKGMFKKLPKYSQEALIKAFPEVEFDFDRKVEFTKKGSQFSKYGVPVTHPKYAKISKFFAHPREWRYTFDLRSSGGWMMSQIDRAGLQGNSNYRPTLEKPTKPHSKTNRVNGVEVKGKDGKWTNYNMKTIVDHPDFKITDKYWSIADKTSKKYLYKFDNLAKLLPEGFDSKKIQLNDLLQFISDKDGVKGLDRAKRAIQIHHEYGVKGKATGGYQLLRQDMNLLANKANNLIKKGGLSNIEKGAADTLAKGVRLNVEGVQYGPKKVSARGDVKSIIAGAETETQKFTKKDWNKFSSLLENLGCPKGGKASGGRVGFSTGTNCAVKGRYLATELLGSGTANTEQKQILKEILRMGSGLMRGVGTMLNPAEFFKLKNIIGPGAWAAMGAFEAGIIGYDTINNNTPLNEALSDNWVTGWAMPWTKKEAQIKNLGEENISGSPAMQKYMEQVKLMAEYERENKVLTGLKTRYGDQEQAKVLYENQQAKLDKINNDWVNLQETAMVERDGEMVPVTGGEIEFQKAVSDMAGERQAGHYDPSDLRNVNEYGYADVGDEKFFKALLPDSWVEQGTPQKKDVQILDERLPPQLGGETSLLNMPKFDVDLTKYKPLASDYRGAEYEKLTEQDKIDLTNYYNAIGHLKENETLEDMVYKDTGKSMLEEAAIAKKWSQLYNYPGMQGSQDPYADGGLAGLMKKYYD
jgi:hypothetical protein